MPGGDRTGPLGQGPYTGRGRNQCNPNATSARPRFGMGRGRGRGYGHQAYASIDSKDLLAQEKKILEERLKYIDSQIEK